MFVIYTIQVWKNYLSISSEHENIKSTMDYGQVQDVE